MDDTADFNPTKYDESVLDIETNNNEDVEIKPERYINQASFSILNALNDPNINSGIIKASSIILYMESLCRADKKLPVNYDENIKKYMVDEKLTSEKPSDLLKVAFKKYELIMSYFFSNKTIKKHLKSYSNEVFE